MFLPLSEYFPGEGSLLALITGVLNSAILEMIKIFSYRFKEIEK